MHLAKYRIRKRTYNDGIVTYQPQHLSADGFNYVKLHHELCAIESARTIIQKHFNDQVKEDSFEYFAPVAGENHD